MSYIRKKYVHVINNYFTATQIAYYHLCHRKLWLQYHHVTMENATSNKYVAEGNLIDVTAYDYRSMKWKSLDLGCGKVDYFDPKNLVIREVKRSNKLEFVHVAQVKYYIYVMEIKGVHGIKAYIDYPSLRVTTNVTYDRNDREDIIRWIDDMRIICFLEKCPDLKVKSYCSKCAYRDFCFI